MTRLQTEAGEIEWEETPDGIFARGTVPQDAEYFQDHFPRFPVLPGVLTLEIFKRIAEDFLGRKTGSPETKWCLRHLSGVRFSAYLRPGHAWEARLETSEQAKGRSAWKASLSSRGRIAAQARLILES